MAGPWQSILESGKYQTWIRDFALTRPDGQRHEGKARLVWDRSEGIRVIAETEGGLGLAMGGGFPAGRVISTEQQYTLEGWTSDDWDLRSKYIAEQPSVSLRTGIASWDFACHDMRFSRDTSDARPSLIWGLLRPVTLVRLTGRSVCNDDNPHFGGTSEKLDWTEFIAPFGKVVLRSVGDAAMLVQVEGEGNLEDLEEALESVRLALGFLEGRQVGVVGHEARAGGKWHRMLYPRCSINENRYYPPLGHGRIDAGGSHEKLIRTAAQFFHDPKGRAVADRLRMCWAMSDGYGSPRVLTTCIAVESLLVQLTAGHSNELGPDEVRARDVILRYIGSEKRSLDTSFVNRLTSFLGMMRAGTPKDILRNWADRGYLGISREDVKAWDRLRHPTAHGELLFNDPDLSKWEPHVYDHARIASLINKLVLGAMGYEGVFFDYADNRPRPFG